MKFRAFILLACMFVVPGMAMFSHRLPAEVRASLRRHLCDPALRGIREAAQFLSLSDPAQSPAESPYLEPVAPAESPAPVAAAVAAPETPTEPLAARQAAAPGPSTPARVVMPTVTLAPANAIAEPIPPQGNGLAVPVATARAAARSFSAAPAAGQRKPAAGPPLGGIQPPPEPPTDPLPLPAPAGPPPQDSPEPPLTPVLDRAGARPAATAVHNQLASLGACAIDCQPLAGAAAGYASSCRLPVDPRGELHRMFYGTGPDATAALRSLVEQVENWQRQRSSASAARL